jgi:hypothetical protein
MNTRIAKLEALLTRIKTNAAAPRVVHAPPPAAEVHEPEPGTLVSARHEPAPSPPPPREVEVPLESRARLVAAPQSEPPMELDADEVIELDDRHVVREEQPAPAITPISMAPPSSGPNSADMTKDALDVAAARAAIAEQQRQIVAQPPAEEPEEAPPPSSRRPIAEPAETPQEAQIEVQHAAPLTPPPESGKQVAAEPLSFDDDQTGVREAPVRPAQEPSIQLQSLRMPAVQQPPPPDEMEVELPGPQEATAPPPGPLPEMRSPRIESAPEPVAAAPEVTRPTRPVAAVNVAEMVGTVKPASPKTFGELLDAALSL